MNRPHAATSTRTRMLLLLVALTIGAGLRASDAPWDALTPRVLKKPEPVELSRNPFHNTVAPVASKSVPRPDHLPATKALAGVARSRIQGVVRAADGSAVLVWGNRLYAPGQTVAWHGDETASDLVVQLKSVGPRSVAFVVRHSTEPDAAPTDLVIPLPVFFASP